MVHNELHALDLAIIGAYLIAMVLIGLVVVKKVRSMDDYYLGGRSFGPLVLMATVCATIIGGSGLMGRAGVAYSSGFKAIMTAPHPSQTCLSSASEKQPRSCWAASLRSP